jgi:hypothetical protein
MGPGAFAFIDNISERLGMGPEPMADAHAKGAVIKVGGEILPMVAVTLVGGTALCVRHFAYGTPVRPDPPRGYGPSYPRPPTR